VAHYANVKDSFWPECPDVTDYNTLPTWILQELEQHDQSWRKPITDEELRLSNVKSTWEEDINNTLECIRLVNVPQNCTKRLVHSFIPEFAPANHLDVCQTQIKNIINNYVPFVDKLDLARDGHHYDILTSQVLVHQVKSLLGL
jgi:hypothetical protein